LVIFSAGLVEGKIAAGFGPDTINFASVIFQKNALVVFEFKDFFSFWISFNKIFMAFEADFKALKKICFYP